MTKEPIDKKLVEHLAKLVKIKLGGDKEKITEDLKKVVGYFEELKEINTENVEPVSGGTLLKNVVRKDEYNKDKELSAKPAVRVFPDNKNGYLKTPPVFE
jgi:aspartyl-tRNA(Asn)/glutamyl-tRNA(Gln) amidotransferase subunit C